VAAIIEGGSSVSDEEKGIPTPSTSTSVGNGSGNGHGNGHVEVVTVTRRRALCDVLGVSVTLRFLLASMTSASSISTSRYTSSASLKKKSLSLNTKRLSSSSAQSNKVLHENYESLSLQSLSTRLCVVAALLECYEEGEEAAESIFSNIISSSEQSSAVKSISHKKVSSSSRAGGVCVLAITLSLVKEDLLGSGTGRHCGEFPDLSSATGGG
jgi:hypothetical protein